jgi:hypothetical protein
MTIAIKPTASGSTIEQNGSTILTVDSSGNITPSNDLYPKVPAFSAYLGSTQAISASTTTKVNFDTIDFDTNSNYDTSNKRFTPSVAGYYQINAWVYGNSAGFIDILIYKNGSQIKKVYYSYPSSSQAGGGSTLIYLNGSTDYIETYIYTTGTPTLINTVTNGCYFQGHLVSV